MRECTLESLAHASAYPQRFSYLTRRTLHAGAVSFKPVLPSQDVALIATEAMLASRAGLHPAIVNLLLETIRDEHDDQGYFEAPGEFPNVEQVDLPVSPDAVRRKHFGPSESQMRQRPNRLVDHDAAVIDDLLKFRGRLLSLAQLQISLAAQVNRVEQAQNPKGWGGAEFIGLRCIERIQGFRRILLADGDCGVDRRKPIGVQQCVRRVCLRQ